jgi:hypothetical protein
MSTPRGRLQEPGVGRDIQNHEERLRTLERGLGGGGGGELEAFWWGNLAPVSVGPAGGIWSVPYLEGASVTFNVVRTYFRFEVASTAGTYTVALQKSPAGGVFTPTTLDTLSLAAGVHEVTHTGSFGTVSSGDLLRVNWTAVGSNAQVFTIQLEGTPV